MPKIAKLRQCLETLKAPFLIETMEGLQAQEKIIIFCEYRSIVNAMHDACAAAGIKAVRLFGADLGTERQKALDTVQDDPEVRGFIGSTVATGVGITPIAATYVTFPSMPWTPVLMGEAEDRTYRLGQQRDVVIIVPLIPGTIDEVVWKILEGKRETEIDVTEAVTTLQTNDAVVLTNTSLKRRVSGEPCWNW
ncbi:helicase-related protein [Alcaligenes faecalis]|uniref:helicase-related protein n=1 Tax=Alcaligenes TaxID=507 RepID=UPI003556E8FC